jgi:hypothetical protein
VPNTDPLLQPFRLKASVTVKINTAAGAQQHLQVNCCCMHACGHT